MLEGRDDSQVVNAQESAPGEGHIDVVRVELVLLVAARLVVAVREPLRPAPLLHLLPVHLDVLGGTRRGLRRLLEEVPHRLYFSPSPQVCHTLVRCCALVNGLIFFSLRSHLLLCPH